jgi:hypothetical protein
VVDTTGTAANREPGAFSSGGLPKSIAAGVAAALVGAVIWAVIVEVSGYEVGFVAVGIGFLVGQAMAFTAGTSQRLPPIGAVLALVGCLLGNAFVDAHELAVAVGSSTGHVLNRMIADPGLAVDIFKAGFQPFDLVFWLIAGYEGFKLTAGGVARVRHQRAAAQAAEAASATTTPPPIHPGFTTPQN